MPKMHKMTGEALKSLVRARLIADQAQVEDLQRRVKQGLGEEASAETPETANVNEAVLEWVSGLTALRLMSDWGTAPIVSSEEISSFVMSIFEASMKADGEKLTAEDREQYAAFVKSMIGTAFDLWNSSMPPGRSPFDEYWRWVNIVIGLADEREMSPVELVGRREGADEITRRMYSREEYVACKERLTNKLADVDALTRQAVQPLHELYAHECADEEERAELKEEIKVLLMPKLRSLSEVIRAIATAQINEDLARIYGSV